MSKKKLLRPTIETLESRIAPAAVVTYPTVKDAELAYDKNPFGDTHFVKAVTDTPILLKAGQVLTTGNAARSGTYLMFVEKGQALVFTTDLNNNGQVDYNEITGIAAGDGLRLTSFVDIHGDIVTNLDADGTLSDSDNNASNDPVTKGDGRVLNNSRIEAITMRSLTAADLTDQNNDDPITHKADAQDVPLRLAFTSYSIFGQIMAGKGFGVAGDAKSGLHIDDTGTAAQQALFTTSGGTLFVPFKTTVGGIRTGSAVNGEYYAFGYSHNQDAQGAMVNFTAPAGQVGGDIYNVASTGIFNFSGAYAGDGGIAARGGDIANVALYGDSASGYHIIAGAGGRGTTGGGGGSIINFTDAGSNTGEVVLQTGSGGEGTNGLGGNGGTLGLGTVTIGAGPTATTANMNVNAGVSINLGDGATGFRGGGAGASLTNLIYRAPDDLGVGALALVSSTHDRAHDPSTGLYVAGSEGVIGRSNSVDFNNDGFNDVVFSTKNPDQVTVAFGDGNGGFLGTYQLDAPANVTAMTIADVNGDGHMDIIVGSTQPGDFSGITVFVAKYENGVDVITGVDANGVNHTGVNDFLGFSSPRISPLPSLAAGDPNDPASSQSNPYKYLKTTNPITAITAGDYDGDGHIDLAVSATYLTPATGANPVPGMEQVLLVLKGDVENGQTTGHFYADFGPRFAPGVQGYLPFQSLGSGSNMRLESTALNVSDTHDVIVATAVKGTLTVGTSSASAQSTSLQVYDYTNPVQGIVQTADLLFEEPDTLRNLNQVLTPPVHATIKDYTIIDADLDGSADFVAISDTPASYLMGILGDGTRTGKAFLNNPQATVPGDNSGYFLGGVIPLSIQGALGSQVSPHGSYTAVVISTGGGYTTYDFVDPNSVTLSLNPGVNKVTAADGSGGPIFDTYREQTSGGGVSYVSAAGTTYQTASAFGKAPLGQNNPLSEHFLQVHAGDGGTGVVGRGGNGGSIGNGKLVDASNVFTGSVDFTLPANYTAGLQGGLVNFQAGDGGEGFTTGGAGGSVGGVAVRTNASATLLKDDVGVFAGNGGLGKSGAGGAGGNVYAVTIAESYAIVAGSGGDGLTGGNGGSILGHGNKKYSDAQGPYEILLAGDGGDGVRTGGNGGIVSNFHNLFNVPFIGGIGGLIYMEAGDGGAATSGAGGIGGDLLNLSPFAGGPTVVGANLLAGDIYLKSGNGGDGSSGGRGGNISGFVNNESGESPGVLAFIAGNGGDGLRGNGGAGGNISGLSVSSKGTHRLGTYTPSRYDFNFGPDYTYNHLIAGNGGSSASAVGGAGGSITSVSTTSSDGVYAVAAGAGGDGLTLGGAGGAVRTLSLAVAGGGLGKGLVVAGAGGNAGAFMGDGSAVSVGFGGVIGKGGLGGSIVGFTQTGATDAHFDLIAGNGGDTINFGSVSNTTGAKYVGAGGSISAVTVQGKIGNTDASVGIKSYNDLIGGESMTDFVNNVLRVSTDASAISDGAGNVGIVVGGAGRLKSVFIGYDDNNQPMFRSIAASGAANGDLINVRASEIMSAVAGSVERIATIRYVQDIIDVNVSSHAPIIGMNKGALAHEFLDKDGNLVDTPKIDGRLIDGALISGSAPTRLRAIDTTFPGGSYHVVIAQ